MSIRELHNSRMLALFVAVAALLSTYGCENHSSTATSNLRNTSTSDTAANTSDTPGAKPAALPPGTKTVALERAGDKPYDKTFDDLRFDIAVGQEFHREMLPASIAGLKDQRIRIRGFILPTPQKNGIKVFVLVRDNQQCCFGPGAALYDCILVEMEPGETTEFSIRPVTVEGTFDIQEVRGPDGKHLAIYHMAAESVE